MLIIRISFCTITTPDPFHLYLSAFTTSPSIWRSTFFIHSCWNIIMNIWAATPSKKKRTQSSSNTFHFSFFLQKDHSESTRAWLIDQVTGARGVLSPKWAKLSSVYFQNQVSFLSEDWRRRSNVTGATARKTIKISLDWAGKSRKSDEDETKQAVEDKTSAN